MNNYVCDVQENAVSPSEVYIIRRWICPFMSIIEFRLLESLILWQPSSQYWCVLQAMKLILEICLDNHTQCVPAGDILILFMTEGNLYFTKWCYALAPNSSVFLWSNVYKKTLIRALKKTRLSASIVIISSDIRNYKNSCAF